jgi:hypothetical protein
VSKALMTHCMACPNGPLLEMPRNMSMPDCGCGWLQNHQAVHTYFIVIVERLSHKVDVIGQGLTGALPEHEVLQHRESVRRTCNPTSHKGCPSLQWPNRGEQLKRTSLHGQRAY